MGCCGRWRGPSSPSWMPLPSTVLRMQPRTTSRNSSVSGMVAPPMAVQSLPATFPEAGPRTDSILVEIHLQDLQLHAARKGLAHCDGACVASGAQMGQGHIRRGMQVTDTVGVLAPTFYLLNCETQTSCRSLAMVERSEVLTTLSGPHLSRSCASRVGES